MNYGEAYTPRERRREIGATFERKPAAFTGERLPGGVVTLHWTVIAVNEKHRTYTAQAQCHGHCLRETFKF